MRTVVTTVTITDDLGGQGEAATVRFGYEGREFEIDLCKRNRETFERHLARYIEHARDVTEVANVKAFNRAARAWATANGWALAERGRVPEDAVAAYRAHLAAEES